MKVAVIGAAGFTGGELLRLLLLHPEVEDIVAASRSAAARSWAEVHPGLASLTDSRFVDAEPAQLSRGCDVVFLALEHGAASKIARAVIDAGPKLVVDLSADFRIHDLELYRSYYGEHPDPELVSQFTYALADVERNELRGRRALAIPGCFATAAALALRPLALAAANQAGNAGAPNRAAGASAPNQTGGHGVSAALFAITGSSGAGTRPKDSTHHPRRASNVEAYAVLGHRHQAEIVERWRAWTGGEQPAPRLITHQGPFVRGIYLTLHARGEFNESGPATLNRAYSKHPFVRITQDPPALTHVVGTNLALLHATVGADGSELQISVALDNLVKGAAGQAVQAMNLALGFPEDTGLKLAGVFPC